MTKSIQKKYEKDFYAWAIHNAQLLRERKLSEIDIENIAEEIESMGKSEKRELISRLAVLLAHLLKWEFQSERRGNSWKYTIKEQRLRLRDLLKESPSLKKSLEENLNQAYEHAIMIAVGETDLTEKIFPAKCPFSLEQAFDQNFFPG
jgi:hypothetical protein